MKKLNKIITMFILVICGLTLALSINKNHLPFSHSLELLPSDNSQEVITITDYDKFNNDEISQEELISNSREEENNIININDENELDDTINNSIDDALETDQSNQANNNTISIIDVDDEGATKETIIFNNNIEDDTTISIEERDLTDEEINFENLDTYNNDSNIQTEDLNNDEIIVKPDRNYNSQNINEQPKININSNEIYNENISPEQTISQPADVDTLEFDRKFINNRPVYTQGLKAEKTSSFNEYSINTLEIETNRLNASQNYELEIVSEGIINVLPDNAEVFIEINYIDMVEKVCKDNAQTLLDNTKTYLESVGITDNDINIYSKNIYPVYRVNNAFKSNIYFSIKVSDLNNLESILDGLENDYVKISSINYCASNSEELCNKALAVSIENAFTKATEISGSENLTLIKAEEEYCFGPCQMYRDYCRSCINDDISTPIEITSSARVTFIVNK